MPANNRIWEVNAVGTRASKKAVGGSIVKGCRRLHSGNEKNDKQNFRVRCLHTVPCNYLILLTYLPNPSVPRFVNFDRSGIDLDLFTLNVADSKRTLTQ